MSNQASTMGPETKFEATPPKAYFITLPPEIRNMIYKYLLVADKPLLSYYTRPEERILGIGRACKQTNQEVFPIYLGMNTFYFDSFNSIERMGRFLGALSKHHRDLVQNIRFEYSGKSRLGGLQLPADCANLQKLEIGAYEETILGSKWKGVDDFDLCASNGMRELFKVRGCKEVVVKFRLRYGHSFQGPKPSQENIKKFEDSLKRELCRPREEGKKERKAKGQGKKRKKQLAVA